MILLLILLYCVESGVKALYPNLLTNEPLACVGDYLDPDEANVPWRIAATEMVMEAGLWMVSNGSDVLGDAVTETHSSLAYV